MARIHVNCFTLLKVGNSMEGHSKEFSALIKQVGNSSSELVHFWQGEDSILFQKEMQKLQEKKSDLKKIDAAYRSYANFVKECAKNYRDAQLRAIERSRRIPL